MSRRAKATAIFSVALFAALLCSVLAEPAFWIGAFGPTSLGMPTPVCVALIVSLLFLPVPWFAWHAMEIVLRGRELGMPLGSLGIVRMFLTIGRRVPGLRGAQAVVAAGFCYFAALVAAWIYYADAHGL